MKTMTDVPKMHGELEQASHERHLYPRPLILWTYRDINSLAMHTP